MNNYYLETEDVIFRPVKMEDSEFIVMLRNLPQAKKMLHGSNLNIEKQQLWMKSYFQRENDYYWIIETKKGVPIGTTSFYNYDANNNQIESGRWIQIPGVSNGGSLSGHVLLNDFAFNVLGVSRIVLDTASFNKQVIKYHLFLGERIYDRVLDDNEINGQKVEVVWFEEVASRWKENRKKLLKFCGNEDDRKVFFIEPDGSFTNIDMHYEKFK